MLKISTLDMSLVAIWWPVTESQQGEVFIEFELQAKNVSETGPNSATWCPVYKEAILLSICNKVSQVMDIHKRE